MTDYIVSYAQNREDIILSGFFKDIEKGFYVDVGANHPTVDSVTKMFYEKGWRGINVEPNQKLYELLKQDRPEDINLNVGVSSSAGKLTLREYVVGHGLSTFSKGMQKEHLKHPSTVTKDYQDYEVDVVTLKDVFKKYDAKTINFIKIDVEGYEYEVIVGNDWDKYRPQVICIEANHIIKDWRPLLKQANYLLTFFDGLNEYYVAKEHPNIREQFSYVDSMLLDKPIVQVYFHDKIQNLHNAQKQTERKLIHEELMNQNMTSELHALTVQQMQYQLQHKRIRVLIKQLGQATNAAILLQIDKLNKPKIKKQEPLALEPSKSPTTLLAELKDYDLRSYYEARAAEPISYKLISGVYNILYKVVKMVLFNFAKLLRKAKNGK